MKAKRKAPKTLIHLPCDECGQVFSRSCNQVTEKTRFCSKQCLWQNRRKHPELYKNAPKERKPAGDKRAKSSGRSHAERTVIDDMKEAIGACEKCGSESNLEGHHVVHRSEDLSRAADPTNIVILCTECHALEHPEISHLISGDHERSGEIINCAVCGAERYLLPSEGHKRHCSKDCYWMEKFGHPYERQKITAVCQVCGVSFTRGSGKGGRMTCCSRSCAAKLGSLKRQSAK